MHIVSFGPDSILLKSLQKNCESTLGNTSARLHDLKRLLSSINFQRLVPARLCAVFLRRARKDFLKEMFRHWKNKKISSIFEFSAIISPCYENLCIYSNPSRSGGVKFMHANSIPVY